MFQFVLSASYISNQLRLARHWADFINPFSGKPHIGQHKSIIKVNETVVANNRLSRSNFKIENNNSCKVISPSKTGDSFVGKHFLLYFIVFFNLNLTKQLKKRKK